MIALTSYVLVAAALAKRGKGSGKRRPMGRYLRGSVDDELSLGTLATKTAIEQQFDETVNERTLVSSLVATWTMSNWTPIAAAGPILVGVAHSDYALSEIEAFIEATGSWNEGDMIQQEIAKRKIRRIGIFDSPLAATDSAVLNDGKPIKTKMNWILLQGQTLNMWAYNLGTASIATTVPLIHAEGHANLWPR